MSNYLVDLHKEIDLLFGLLKKNNIKLNVKTLYILEGGSPTILNKEDLKKLVDKLKEKFDFNNLNEFTIETDPRRVDEDRLIYNSKVCEQIEYLLECKILTRKFKEE